MGSGMKRDAQGRWKAGQSPNPAGRPKGVGLTAQMREALKQATPLVLKSMIQRAIDGDTKAAAIVLARSMPELRPTDEVLPIDLGDGTAADRGRRAVDALATGEVSPQQAEAALATLTSLARLVESTELEARIAQLEATQKKLQGWR